MSCTQFGKIMRILRIEHGETMKDIADILGVTGSFLSAVENGKRNIPSRWNAILSAHYSSDESDKLLQAIDLSKTQITFNLQGVEPFKRELILQFERAFKDIDEPTAKEILRLLSKGGKRL